MEEENRFRHAAIEYMTRGWSVIPLRAKEKKPTLSSWSKYQNQSAMLEEILEWWDRWPNANVGLVTGKVSGIIVLDVDGPEGMDTLQRIEARFGDLPETPTSSTGKGKHYIFRHPGGDLRNFAKRGINLDFRGDGGYIVAPPSIHPNGGTYSWEVDPDFTDLADLPDWLLELLRSEQVPAWYEELFPSPNKDHKPGPAKKVEGQAGNGPADTILKNCAFCKYCRDSADTLSEPEWYSMITNLARADGGQDLIHELSKPHPKYNPKETDQKIEHALQDGEPHTCQYIQQTLAFTGCPDGGCGVKAPIGFVTSPVVAAKLTVTASVERFETNRSIVDLFNDPETIGALAVLKKQEPAEYAQLKKRFKEIFGKDLNLNDLERAVNKKIAENQKLRLVEPDESPPSLTDILPNMPNQELRKPYAWTLNENGIWQETKFGPVCACPVPVLLTKRLHNVDTGEERVELSFFRDGSWKHVVTNRSTVFNRTSLISLADKGLPISSESSKHLVRYLSDFERENLNLLPLSRSVSRMGWVGSKTFLPGVEDGIELDVDNGSGAGSIAGGYRQEGEMQEWVSIVKKIREYPLARFVLSASFAAPLLRIVNQRVFIVHNWGPSRGGKTASLKAALSVWGEPEEIMASFNATKVGLERLAAFYSDLPLGIDERQVVGDKQGFVESLVYLLGLGKGKARGAKGGGIQAFSSWRTIALTTGEEPLSTESSTAGIKTRALELYGVPIPNEKLASEIHQAVGQNFGVAGPMFVQRLLQEMENDPEIFKTDYEAIQSELSGIGNDNLSSHLSAISTICMADYYASKWIFGLSDEEAYNQAMDLAQVVMGQLETAAEADDGARAYEFFTDFVLEKQNYFGNGEHTDFYGWVDGDYTYVLGSRFDKMMKDQGFSPRRVLKDWVDRSWIQTAREGDRIQVRVSKYCSVVNKSVRVVAVKRNVFSHTNDENM